MSTDFSNIKRAIKSSKVFTQLSSLSLPPQPQRTWIIVGISVTAFFIISNIGLAIYHRSHFYPHVKIGAVLIGGMNYNEASTVLSNHIDRQRIRLAFDQNIKTLTHSELGAQFDVEASLRAAQQLPDPVLPMLAYTPLAEPQQAAFSFHLNEQKFNETIDEILKDTDTEPVDAKLEIKDGHVAITPDKPGRLHDAHSVKEQLKGSLAILGPDPIAINAQPIPVKVSVQDLQPAKDQAEQMMGILITLAYGDKKFQPDKKEIGSWLGVNDKLEIVVENDKVAAYVAGIAGQIDQAVQNKVILIKGGQEIVHQEGQAGLRLDQQDAVQEILTALEQQDQLDQELAVTVVEPATIRPITYYYCITSNQVDESLLGHFSQKTTATLADARGWGLGGRVLFQEVGSGCTFNLVLAKASTLPAYSSSCSVDWSCRVGSNVIINVNNWLNGTDSWNRAGGSIDDYQVMVINHEVGHWLGFGHDFCSGAGPAPIMMQQSIYIEQSPCSFNPWPTASELSRLRAIKGF